jgi:hypothetical protein
MIHNIAASEIYIFLFNSGPIICSSILTGFIVS